MIIPVDWESDSELRAFVVERDKEWNKLLAYAETQRNEARAQRDALRAALEAAPVPLRTIDSAWKRIYAEWYESLRRLALKEEE